MSESEETLELFIRAIKTINEIKKEANELNINLEEFNLVEDEDFLLFALRYLLSNIDDLSDYLELEN